MKFWNSLQAEMLELHDHGLNAGDLGKYFLVCIGCKGDTPALVKAGVSRSFYNMAKRGQNTNGICCSARQASLVLTSKMCVGMPHGHGLGEKRLA